MSTDPSGAAIGRIDTAVDNPSPRAEAISPRELADLAATIERVEALIAADATLGADGSDALERIADIAFVLHERDVEPSLCDALDAAVREIGNAEAVRQASVERAQQAAEMLRELSRRLNDLIAVSEAAQRTAPPEPSNAEPAKAEQDGGDETVEEEIPRDGLFETDVREDDAFAQAVAALAGSLPALADEAESTSDPQHEPADISAEPPDRAQQLEPPAPDANDASVAAPGASSPPSETAVEAALHIESSSAELSSDPSLPPMQETEELPVEDVSRHESPATENPGEQASRDASLPSFNPPIGQEGREEAIFAATVLNEIPSSEASSSEDGQSTEIMSVTESQSEAPGQDSPTANEPTLPAFDAIMPPSPTENLSPPAAEAPVYGGTDINWQPAEPDIAAHEVEGEQKSHSTVDADGQIPIDAGGRGASAGDEVRPPVEADAPRALPPESQTLVDPNEDPGDLFETLADAPLAAPIEPATPAVAPMPAPPPPNDAAVQHDQIVAPPVESPADSEDNGQAAASSPEPRVLDEVPAPAAEPPALLPAAGQDAKPDAAPPPSPPPRAVARPAPSDPLAPVRALSEEELIALFS